MKSNANYFLFFLTFKALFLDSKSYLKCDSNSQNLLTPITGIKPKMASEKLTHSSENQFALELSQQLGDSTNNLFSPISISIPFVMLSFGASGLTLKELQQVFHIKSAVKGIKNYRELTHRYASFEGTTQVSFANMLLFSEREKFMDFFTESVSGLGKIVSVDFHNSSEVQEMVNKWVSEKTHNKISNIMQDPPDQTTRLIIVNAIYFKGVWEKPFSKALTRRKTFSNYNSSTTEVDMMFNQDSYFYANFDQLNIEMIELPYENGFCMYVLLPSKSELHKTPLKKLSLDQLQWMISSLEKQTVQLYMPKFNYSCEMNLKEELMKLGLKSIFDTDSSKLTNITKETLFVSKALHKTTIEVNEEGTEATGSTFVKVSSRSLFVGPEMHVDHPFCFLIVDKTNLSVLFRGCVNSL